MARPLVKPFVVTLSNHKHDVLSTKTTYQNSSLL